MGSLVSELPARFTRPNDHKLEHCEGIGPSLAHYECAIIPLDQQCKSGAPPRNRTPVKSLQNSCSTIKLAGQKLFVRNQATKEMGLRPLFV